MKPLLAWLGTVRKAAVPFVAGLALALADLIRTGQFNRLQIVAAVSGAGVAFLTYIVRNDLPAGMKLPVTPATLLGVVAPPIPPTPPPTPPVSAEPLIISPPGPVVLLGQPTTGNPGSTATTTVTLSPPGVIVPPVIAPPSPAGPSA